MRRVILLTVRLSLLAIFSGGLASTAAHASAAGGYAWKWYTNVRFGYAICYPAELLVSQGESPNGDGQKFMAKNGAQLIVFGGNNALNESLKGALAHAESRLAGMSGKITYKALRPTWFVVSGEDGQTLFYDRTLYSHNQFKSLELTYQRSVAAIYEPLISRLSRCFTDLAR